MLEQDKRHLPASGISQDEPQHDQRPPSGHDYSSISVGGNASAHFGDVYNQYFTACAVKNSPAGNESSENGHPVQLGLHIGKAPTINSKLFIGRQSELQYMKEILLATSDLSGEQKILVLGGIGGMGKTQLTLAYARQHHSSYGSVVWLNATSETSLKASFRTVAARLLTTPEYQSCDEEQILICVHRWLSLTNNTRWLLIYDNYDEPEEFDIEQYYPPASHGAIIVTTRSPEQVSGEKILLRPLEHTDDSLQILQTRSGRANISSDHGALRLAERLAGLPLALATAGAYLKRSTLTCEQYLQGIEQQWNIDPHRPVRLSEYQARTLYSTWDLSFNRLKVDDPDAAKILILLAYFDHQALWYELLRTGIDRDSPQWLIDVTSDMTNFDNRMATLVEYCLVDVLPDTQSYSIHACVHDWTLAVLNKVVDPQSYWYALDCVIGLIGSNVEDFLGQVKYNRIARHAARLAHPRFQNVLESKLSVQQVQKLIRVANLLHKQTYMDASEKLHLCALNVLRMLQGNDHSDVLIVLNAMGNLYYDKHMLKKAEEMYLQALEGRERVLGPSHLKTLQTVNNLGSLYSRQGDLKKAEVALKRALVGNESQFGSDHHLTLHTVHCLGNLYLRQEKLVEAELMYSRALVGWQKLFGDDHNSTLNTLNNIAALHMERGNLEMSEETYRRVLAGKERTLGPDNSSTLATVHNLGVCLDDQGNSAQAKLMFQRALTGKLKVLGPKHHSTHVTIKSLELLNTKEGEREKSNSA